MKYVLVALVLMVAIGIWRNKRRKAAASSTPQRHLRTPEDMLTCAHCGLHLPASDAVIAKDHRTYCCAEHLQAGASHP